MASRTKLAQLYGWPSKKKLICFDEGTRPQGGLEIFCSLAGPVPSNGRKDAAGQFFHTQALKQAGAFVYPKEEEPDSSECPSPLSQAQSANLDSDQPPPGVNWKGSKKKKQKKKDGKALDLYALLGLANERWTANDKQLKDAYRRTCLEHHPDKKQANVTSDEEKARIEDHFKQVQEAYLTLSDPVKRREFDSVDEFDDSLPMECASADFYKVFCPAFRRNSRWSAEKGPVPDPGDANTPWEELDRFYNFWFTFKSWREFPHPDEEDSECAESREHKRWIDRTNQKLREKSKKDEYRRLRDFVEAAYKMDPRVVAHKEEEKLEKERKKAEKEDGKLRAINDALAAQAAQEAEKKAAVDAAKEVAGEAKKTREAAKREVKKQRQRLRLVNDGSEGDNKLIDIESCETLCMELKPEQLQDLNDKLGRIGATREEQKAVCIEALTELLGAAAVEAAAEAAAKDQLRKDAETAAKNQAKLEHDRKMSSMREWDEEELRMLDKALTKFPQGTSRRWDAVAAYVRTRTLDEVLLMVKDKQGASATRYKAQEDFRAGIKKMAVVNCQADLRSNAFTDVNINMVGDAAVALMPQAVNEASSTVAPATPAPAASNGSATGTAAPATANGHASAEAGSKASGGKTATPSSSATSTATAAGIKSQGAAEGGQEGDATSQQSKSKVITADSGDWSAEQEQALVKALKQFGKELGTERWERVAAIVPDKSKSLCMKRFKELREAFRAKKEEEEAAAAAAAAAAEDADDGGVEWPE